MGLGKRAAAAMVGAKLKRINCGVGEPLVKLTKAVSEWDAKTGTILEVDKKMQLKRYAELVAIPYQTLVKYCRSVLSKRHVIGKSVGARPLFKEKEQQFVVDVICRHDRGNDGLNKRQCVDKLHDLRPDINRKAATNVCQGLFQKRDATPPPRTPRGGA